MAVERRPLRQRRLAEAGGQEIHHDARPHAAALHGERERNSQQGLGGLAQACAARALARPRTGEPDASQADLEAAIRAAGPRDGWPHAARGALALLRDDRDAVTLELTQAWLRNPNDSLTLALLPILQSRPGDSSGSLAPSLIHILPCRRPDPF